MSALRAYTKGALLAIEELLLNALCNPGFFNFDSLYDLEDEYLTRAPLHVFRVTLEGPPRYHDYTWLDQLTRAQSSQALLSTMPLTAWRLCQLKLLRNLAFQWLCLHEAAHWLTGHLEWLGSDNSQTDLGLCLSDPEFQLDMSANSADSITKRLKNILLLHQAPSWVTASDARKCIEYQADSLGFQLLAYLQRQASTANFSAYQRYEQAMARIGLPDFFENVAVLDEASRARAMLIAAGAVILLIERGASYSGSGGDYPIPLGRLLNLQTTVVTASPFVEIRDGESYLNSTLVQDGQFLSFPPGNSGSFVGGF